jgi:hypothetical protein
MAANHSLLTENRALGWASAEAAPDFAKKFITEFRQAHLDKREMRPDFLRTFNVGAEKRSLALGQRAAKFITTLFPVQSYEQKFIAENGYDPWLTRMRAHRQAVEIVADNARFRRLDAARASHEMWNDFSAAGTERIRREVSKRDVSCDGPGFRCAAGSLSSSGEEHAQAAISHSVLAGRCKDLDSASAHYEAAHRHVLAAEKPTSANLNGAVAACKRAFEPGDN